MALARQPVGPPAHEARAVAEAPAGDVIVLHLDDQPGPQWLPLTATLGRPAAGTARRIAGEAGAAAQPLELARQRRPVGIGYRRREADMIEQALIVIEAEQQ